jgi:hypothetical protein
MTPIPRYILMKGLRIILYSFFIAIFLPSCMEDDILPISEVDLYGSRGVFIVNEGNFLYGNSSLSYYDIESKTVVNNIFSLANGIPLGDVAYSMTIHNGRGYIVVNNSGCIHVVDANTLLHIGTVVGLPSPRHILFLDDERALVSDLYARAISIINIKTHEVVGSIKTGEANSPFYQHSSEYLIRIGSKVFTNSWSYDNKVLVIDAVALNIIDTIEVGIQPLAMAKDKNDNLWVMNDGGFMGNPLGYETPSIMKINSQTHEVELSLSFASLTDNVGQIATNSAGDSIYFISNHLYAMGINETKLPGNALIPRNGRNFRALSVDFKTGDIYISDATDFMSEGVVYRYKANGTPLDTIGVGIIPGNFSFN